MWNSYHHCGLSITNITHQHVDLCFFPNQPRNYPYQSSRLRESGHCSHSFVHMWKLTYRTFLKGGHRHLTHSYTYASPGYPSPLPSSHWACHPPVSLPCEDILVLIATPLGRVCVREGVGESEKWLGMNGPVCLTGSWIQCAGTGTQTCSFTPLLFFKFSNSHCSYECWPVERHMCIHLCTLVVSQT